MFHVAAWPQLDGGCSNVGFLVAKRFERQLIMSYNNTS